MNYGKIFKQTTSDGPGIRVSLYVSGCRNHCPGCHNYESQSFSYGKEFSENTVAEIMSLLDHPYIAGLSLVGGEPMEEENQRDLVNFVDRVRTKYPEKNIWCYTGYEFEDLAAGGRKHCEVTDKLLSMIDVLIVGRFILEQRDITDKNRWRGSLNQRVLDLKQSLSHGKPVALKDIPNNEIK